MKWVWLTMVSAAISAVWFVVPTGFCFVLASGSELGLREMLVTAAFLLGFIVSVVAIILCAGMSIDSTERRQRALHQTDLLQHSALVAFAATAGSLALYGPPGTIPFAVLALPLLVLALWTRRLARLLRSSGPH